MSAWLQAYEWCLKTPGVPHILKRLVEKRAAPILNRRARPKSKPPIRAPKALKAKRVPLPKLKKELDRVFSLFIRQRDSDPIIGFGKCCTCNHAAHWREMDAGHYVPRQDMATRWEERNVHLQCQPCNAFRGGEPEKMSAYIDRRWPGQSVVLKELARQPFKPTRQWYETKIAHYKAQIKETND